MSDDGPIVDIPAWFRQQLEVLPGGMAAVNPIRRGIADRRVARKLSIWLEISQGRHGARF
jgi:hypothetical protein